MSFDPLMIPVGLFVGLVVGLTGMGGGALMTPILILLFKVQPLAAVSSDLMASLIMKPVGGAVHLRRATVHRGIVRWLMLGSIPSAFSGVLLLRAIGGGSVVQGDLKLALGAALVLAVAGLLARAWVQRRREDAETTVAVGDVEVRRVATLTVGVLGGLIVGMTSVGSGSLMIVALMLLYPRLSMNQLVGTDLVQAVPLVGSAALGQLLFGDFRLGLTAALLVGALPGVYLGARLSAVARSSAVRWALAIVLASSGVKLLGASNAVLLGVAVGGGALWLAAATRSMLAVRRRPAAVVVGPSA